MKLNWLKTSAILGAIGSLGLVIAQTIFQDWWNSSENEARAKLDQQQTEYLSRSVEMFDRQAEVLTNLDEKMEEIVRRTTEVERRQAALPEHSAPSGKRGPATEPEMTGTPNLPSTNPPEIGISSTPAPSEEEAPGTTKVSAQPQRELSPSVPDAPEAPQSAANPTETSSELEARTRNAAELGSENVFGVFEAQTFTLCGYTGFKAELVGRAASEEVQLSSRNREVPGAGFRGFEKRLPLKQPAELWQGCTVAIGAVEVTGQAKRLIISVAEGKRV